ncbi:MAG: Ig-like domain-containing protein [Candidatus Zixiibacteriota bacterium]
MIKLTYFKTIQAVLLLAGTLWLGCGDDDDNATNSTNNPPVIDSVTASPDTFDEGGTTTIAVFAHDPENDNLSYLWDTRESWLTPIISSGNITQMSNCCNISQMLDDYVIATVSDGHGGSDVDSVQVWVIPTKK